MHAKMYVKTFKNGNTQRLLALEVTRGEAEQLGGILQNGCLVRDPVHMRLDFDDVEVSLGWNIDGDETKTRTAVIDEANALQERAVRAVERVSAQAMGFSPAMPVGVAMSDPESVRLLIVAHFKTLSPEDAAMQRGRLATALEAVDEVLRSPLAS